MKGTGVDISGRESRLYKDSNAEFLLVQPIDEHDLEVLDQEVEINGRFYEVRNRFQLLSVHAWGTTAFRKEDVENAIAKYNEEQGKAQQEAYPY